MHALDRRELRDTSFSVKLRCEIFLWRRRHDCVRPDARERRRHCRASTRRDQDRSILRQRGGEPWCS